MKISAKKLSLLSLLILLSISCKDKSEDSETGTEFPSEFQKVWQDDEFTSDGDEIGIYFTDTKIGFWDYDGDDFDQGDDCYFISEEATLISFEGDIYTIEVEDPDGTERIEAEITINNGKLIIDDPEESEPFSHTDTGDSVSDLSPLCPGNLAKRLSTQNKSIPFLRY
ncbi:MAG: hypothetical protein RIC57_09490 [Balneola sp.]